MPVILSIGYLTAMISLYPPVESLWETEGKNLIWFVSILVRLPLGFIGIQQDYGLHLFLLSDLLRVT